jgi:EAL domain-containing protein (putative c-di-GMP-specific phosphodiesterase class I)
VDLKSGAVRAVHATPRWRHGSRGVLAPPDFMPAIRARGLQDDFAWAMLQQCAVQGRAWHDAGRKLAVCAELGFDGLADVQLAARIRQTADDAGLESRHLVLGVPEAALAGAPARVLENLARLRMDGFGLAIEKFGKGRMDVERLATVAFTEVRIRSSFVANAHDDHGARAGLAVALDHARQLHLKAVAEGVASKEEWRLLHDWGCHYGAGPFIADPMPAEAVLPWLARWSGATIR